MAGEHRDHRVLADVTPRFSGLPDFGFWSTAV